MQRQHDLQPLRQLATRRPASARATRARVDVAGPVQRAGGVFARGQTPRRLSTVARSRASARFFSSVSIITLPTKKILSGGDAFGAQVVGGVAFGGEQVVGNLIGQDAVDLFGHRAVAAAKARFDVRDLDAALHRDERARERRIHVADDEHDVGGMFVERFVERGHDARGLHGVAGRADFEVQVGLGNLQIAEELRRHVVVVVLPGVHQSQLDVRDVRAAWMMGATFMKFGRAPAMTVRLSGLGQIAALTGRQKSSNRGHLSALVEFLSA